MTVPILPFFFLSFFRHVKSDLKHTPALPPAIATLLAPTHHTLLALLQLAQALHLLEHVLEQVLAAYDIEVTLNFWILLGKALDFFL